MYIHSYSVIFTQAIVLEQNNRGAPLGPPLLLKLTLPILMGGFNYVAHRRDRFSKPDGNAPDSHEATEESHFCRVLGDPFGFCELHQEEFTHDSALGRSRLDRVYSNHYLTDQLDRRIGCAALSWVPWLSAHRPVAFFRRRPSAAITTTSHFRQRL